MGSKAAIAAPAGNLTSRGQDAVYVVEVVDQVVTVIGRLVRLGRVGHSHSLASASAVIVPSPSAPSSAPSRMRRTPAAGLPKCHAKWFTAAMSAVITAYRIALVVQWLVFAAWGWAVFHHWDSAVYFFLAFGATMVGTLLLRPSRTSELSRRGDPTE